ncbi:MAG TPA: zinc ribbon domain-containing protein [Ktedonobacterales bacterium]|nr:zinc ribbon domain-containing protein [Ktedonobacterales bacterium]
METRPTQDTPPAVCPACAAPVATGTHFCSLCGTPLQPTATPDASAGATSASSAGGMRQCAWCGTLSPAQLDRCTACGAMFPRPEMDAAVERAAEQWMRSALGDLEARREKRLRKGLGKLFG